MSFRLLIAQILLGGVLVQAGGSAAAAQSVDKGQLSAPVSEQTPEETTRDCARYQSLVTLRQEYGLTLVQGDATEVPPCAIAVSHENGE